MASKLRPPDELSFSDTLHLAENWRMWKQEMKLYLNLTMSKSTEIDKCSAFLYIIGRPGREIFNTWSLPEDQQNKIDILFEKFEAYCKPKHNVIMERYRFNSRVQQENESLDEFLTDLKKLALMCEYNNLQQEMLRDRLVVGIRKAVVKERLLREPELTLESAISICRADEESQKSLTLMKGPTNNVHSIKSHKMREKQKPQKKSETVTAAQATCRKCGFSHKPKSCPAYGKTCRVCNKPNHFAKMCRAKKIIACAQTSHTSSEEDSDHENYFMGAISSKKNTGIASVKNRDWNVTLDCKGKHVSFKLDTGVQANVISKRLAEELRVPISPTSAKLTAYSGEQIPVSGKTTVPCFYKGKRYSVEFVVATVQSAQSILGLTTCEEMLLIQKVCKVSSSHPSGIEKITQEYADTFGELGCIDETHSIQLDDKVRPVVAAARRIPLALRDKLQEELSRMERLGVIAKVEEPTDWVNPMIVVKKPNGSLRICMDPKRLNKAIKREHYQLPTLDEVITEMNGAKYFTKLDASSGFWAIQLDDRSSKICTFATPSGRYRFLRLPFGIKSAPEVFQRVMHKHFGDIEGVVCYEDDLCIWSETYEEHMLRLRQVFERARKCGIKFNKSKCDFLKKELKYLGHILTDSGVKADPDKISAIAKMPAPEDKQGLMRFLGMVTYLTKFVPNMSERTAPLRELLQDDVPWQWLPHHEQTFRDIQEILITSPVLQYFDPKKEVVVTADACKDGLGAALLQENNVVAYASRALTNAEKNYAMIEKEMLAIVSALERFHQFVYGRQVLVETDHKPLVAIHSKEYSKCPARIQRFLLRLQAYDVIIKYKKGTEQVLSDTLSRAVDTEADASSEIPDEEIKAFVNMVLTDKPATPRKLEEIREEQQLDQQCHVLKDFIRRGWPTTIKDVPEMVRPYWTFRDELTVCDDILMKGQQVIIPKSMQKEMLMRTHEGHSGIEMSKERARPHMFWPGISKQIEELVSECPTCQKFRKQQQRLPLQSHVIPEHPFEKVGADLFHYGKQNYLLVVDYTSKFFEVCLLRDTTSYSVIQQMKSIFARHGIPVQLITDNGPQFSAAEFRMFMSDWQIIHDTSSPLYPRSNGLAERTVQTVKSILKKAQHSGEDPYLSMLNFRTTRKPDQPSPAEILMGRKLRTLLPTVMKPKEMVSKQLVAERLKKSARYYNVHTREQPTLQPDATIRYRDHRSRTWEPARVLDQVGPRSYNIQTKSGVLRRNRQDILQSREPPHDLTPDPVETTSRQPQLRTSEPDESEVPPRNQDEVAANPSPQYTTRSGRSVVKPLRYRQ